MDERGHSLVELIVVLGLLALLGTMAIPHLRAYSVEAHLLGAGRIFKGEFRKARSTATMLGVNTALRFEEEADGWYVGTYRDGNHNGVLAADIRRGIDVRLGRKRMTSGAHGVRIGINEGTPAIPPDRGILDTNDPIRFGRAEMLSFSPLGTATPGTFYLAGEFAQAAVRVTPATARVRMMVCRGGQWVER